MLSGYVGDVGDVYVDEIETDFVQFRLYIATDRRQKTFAIGVDLFDGQRRDRQTQLTENNFSRHLFNFRRRQSQQAFGRIHQHVGIRANPDGKRTGHVNADVLEGERIL